MSESRNTNGDIRIIPRISQKERDEIDGAPDPNPIVAQCGECERLIRRVDHYVCRNKYCPVGQKGKL